MNRYPDFVAYLVRQLKVLAPSLGKKRIADMLARAGLHLSASTVGRMLKRELSKEDVGAVVPVAKGRVSAKRPNDTWGPLVPLREGPALAILGVCGRRPSAPTAC